MIAAFKVLGVVLAWIAVNDAFQFGFYMYGGIDPEYATQFLFSGLFSICVKAAGAILLIFSTENVLSILRINPASHASVGAMPLAAGAASLVGTYFLVQGLAIAVSTYVIASIQFSAIKTPGDSLLTTRALSWPWHDFAYGLVEALLGLALLAAILAYNKKMHATSA
ncbi:MAG: hypothetical protein ACK4SX_07360 [Alcanivoracaceae bacterium]